MTARVRFTNARLQAQRGVALLEAMLAVVLLAIGLMGTLVLQARSVAALSESGMRAEATIAANQLLGVMTTDLDNLSAYALSGGTGSNARVAAWATELRKNIPGATVAITVQPQANTSRTRVGITIGWQRTSDSQANSHSITSYLSRSQ